MKTEKYYKVLIIVAFFVLSILSAAVTARSNSGEINAESSQTELTEDGGLAELQ